MFSIEGSLSMSDTQAVTQPNDATALAPRPVTIATLLLDRSGSMNGKKAATIEGVNAYLEGLAAERQATILVNFITFDSLALDTLAVAKPAAEVAKLTDETYLPRGGTPLLDAVGETIAAIERALAERRDTPKVVVAIQTDGEENQSRGYSWEEINQLVTTKTAAGWEFLFMGCDLNAYDQGAKLGIGRGNTMAYSASMAETRAAFSASASNTSDYAGGRAQNTNYSAQQKGAAGDVYDNNNPAFGGGDVYQWATGGPPTTVVMPGTLTAPNWPPVTQPPPRLNLTGAPPPPPPRPRPMVGPVNL